jgi:hypothetical protein
MSGTNHRGFDWNEIAQVLHMTRAVAQATFWREIKRLRPKRVETASTALVVGEERDSEPLKLRKRRASG